MKTQFSAAAKSRGAVLDIPAIKQRSWLNCIYLDVIISFAQQADKLEFDVITIRRAGS